MLSPDLVLSLRLVLRPNVVLNNPEHQLDLLTEATAETPTQPDGNLLVPNYEHQTGGESREARAREGSRGVARGAGQGPGAARRGALRRAQARGAQGRAQGP